MKRKTPKTLRDPRSSNRRGGDAFGLGLAGHQPGNLRVQFVGNLNGYVHAGEIASAKDALRHLQAMSVEQISVGGRIYLITDLINMLDNPAMARSVLGDLVAMLQVSGKAYFVAGNRD